MQIFKEIVFFFLHNGRSYILYDSFAQIFLHHTIIRGIDLETRAYPSPFLRSKIFRYTDLCVIA